MTIARTPEETRPGRMPPLARLPVFFALTGKRVVLAGGSTIPRNLPVPGRELKGVHFAMDFLKQQNKRVANKEVVGEDIFATAKNVVVIGGGDTGSDCVGTSNRHGALSVTQFELLPKPPEPLPPPPITPPAAPPLAVPPAPPSPPSVLRPPSGRVYGPPDTGGSPASRDTERVGTAPNGEPLYAASWYREPSDDELRGYLSTASGPGWGLIACRTAPDYRVEDCVGLDEYPTGSQINRAVLAAAWQFKVRPPRVGGRVLVGSWVRIRIDYGRR